MEMTLEMRAEIVREAYRQQAQAGLPPGVDASTWGIDVLGGAILVRGNEDGQLYRVPYTMSADTADSVTFGAPVAVEVQLVPVSESEVELTAPTGDRWAVRIIREGFSKAKKPVPPDGKEGRWYYTRNAIESVPAVFEGSAVYAFEFSAGNFGHLWGLPVAEKIKKGMIANLIGYFEHVREANGEALAELVMLKDAATEAVREKLTDLFRRGRQDLVGLSIDARVRGVPIETKEGMVFAVMGFEKPATSDVATHPAAGGAFLRALESLPEKEATMVKELLAKLRARRPDLATALGETPTEAQVQEALLQALDGPGTAQGSTGAEAQEAIRKDLDESRKLRCSLVLDRTLAGAKLPAPVEKRVRARYDGRIFEAAALEADITGEKETLDALAQEGHVHGLGTPRAEVVLEQKEKLQLGMDRMFGAAAKEAEAQAQDVPAFRSFRHAFKTITGRDLEDMLNHRIATAQEAIVAASWPSILGTSMHRRLLKDYAEPAYGEDLIVSVRPGGIANFKTQEALRVGYFPDLASIDPETNDYHYIAEPDDEGVSYAVQQKGNLLAITRKVLLNDDLGAVTKMVGRLGRAARRTKARFIWSFWIDNATYDVDGTAWFTAGAGSHANLVTTTLTADQTGAANILAALILLGKMTEPGSGEMLGLPALRDLRLSLVVPIDLMGVAHQLNSAETLPTAGNVQVPNPVYQRFGPNDERIIINPLLTDTTDWGIFRDPADVDSIEVGYLNDQREPEFFIASVPTIGQMFIADKQEYKVRHEYGAEIVDYRGAVKSIQ